jgi:hypothetical protein
MYDCGDINIQRHMGLGCELASHDPHVDLRVIFLHIICVLGALNIFLWQPYFLTVLPIVKTIGLHQTNLKYI